MRRTKPGNYLESEYKLSLSQMCKFWLCSNPEFWASMVRLGKIDHLFLSAFVMNSNVVI